MKNSWLAALALVLTIACGSDDPAPPDGTGGSGGGGGSGGSGAGASTGCSDDPGTDEFPCDVGVILEAKCQRCHSEDCSSTNTCVKAPFPLGTWADTRELYGGTPVYEHIARVVESGFMPLNTDDISPPVEPLTESEKTVLIEWAESCALPAAAPCD